MALGKAEKKRRNHEKKIQPKLEAKVLTEDYYIEFKKILNSRTDKYFDKEKQIEVDNKFKMYVYSYPLFAGEAKTKKEWLKWINNERKYNENGK